MAYGTKFRFRFESCHGSVYEVRLREDGYSGSVTDRPLGKAPVLRMQNGNPFLSTCCELSLECQVDGEYVSLYTTDPNHYKIEIYCLVRDLTQLIWDGYVATELYSEPDIAPPYDVRITATDGLGILKEYDFEAAGALSVRQHIVNILKKTGDASPILYTASQLRESSGTAAGFLDSELIDLDYLVGENCYDVLGKLLTSMRCVITRYRGYWVVVRKVDVQLSSVGLLTAIYSPSNPNTASSSGQIHAGTTLGQMGVATLWPNGYLTRRVVPAKRSVTVQAPWYSRNGFPEVTADGWTHGSYCTYNTTYYTLGVTQNPGSVYYEQALTQFAKDLRIGVKANVPVGSVAGYVSIRVSWYNGYDGTWYYYKSTGWTTSAQANWGSSHNIDTTNYTHDPGLAESIQEDIPAYGASDVGILRVEVVGYLVDVYNISVEFYLRKGYQDKIVINNGARGDAQTIEITGGRRTAGNRTPPMFLYGIFYSGSGAVPATFCDGSNTDRDYMSLTALAYAKEHATPQIEVSGKMNNVYSENRRMPPLFVYTHGVWAMLSEYDWDMLAEDIDFKAETLPTATLTVDTETITSMTD